MVTRFYCLNVSQCWARPLIGKGRSEEVVREQELKTHECDKGC